MANTKKNPLRFAELAWTPEDLQELTEDPETGVPKLTQEDCVDWFLTYERRIQERMCEVGWEILKSFLEIYPPEKLKK